jgi:DHA2 family multidrug resistance protein-like MFS transporter
MAFAASYMLTFALPFLLVQVRNEGPGAAGRALAVYAIARSLVAWYSGRWSDRLDNRLLAVPGLVVFLCGVVALSRMDTGSQFSALMAGVGAAGLGFGCFVPPNNNTLMQSVPRELYGFAAGMMATSRTLGMAAGVALDGALLPVAGGTLASRAALALRVAAMLAAAAAITGYRANAGPQRTTAR